MPCAFPHGAAPVRAEAEELCHSAAGKTQRQAHAAAVQGGLLQSSWITEILQTFPLPIILLPAQV